MLPILPLKPNRKRKKYRLGNAFPLPRIQDVPLIDFELDQNPIEDQRSKADTIDDMCTAYALTSVLEPQEGVQLDPGYSFAKGKQREGHYDTFGLDLDDIGMGAVKYGALPISKSPFPDKPRSFVANWNNWPVLYDEYAKEHRQAAMLWVHGPNDTFDNIRCALWLLKNLPEPRRRAGILAGSYWYPQFNNAPNGVIQPLYFAEPGGHAHRIRSQKIINGIPHIGVQNSYGLSTGQNGLHYFPREVVNKLFTPYGQLVFVDLDSEEIARLENFIIRALKKVLALLQQQSNPAPIVEPEPIKEPEPMPEPETLQAMARRVCKEVGLTTEMTRHLMATIHGESGWNPKARGRNYDKKTKKLLSTDWGLCQLNDKWYVGPKCEIKTPEEAIANPEKCVRVMAKAWKKGRAVDWRAYKYKSYLSFIHLY